MIFNPGLSLDYNGGMLGGTGLGSLNNSLADSSGLNLGMPLGGHGTTVVMGNGGNGFGYAVAVNPEPPLSGASTTVELVYPASGPLDGFGYEATFDPRPLAGNGGLSVIFGTPPLDPPVGPAIADPPPHRVARADSQVLNTFLFGVILIDGGVGYCHPPAIQVVGGGGQGARVEARVAHGTVTGLVVTDPGSGYTGVPTLFVAPPSEAPTVGIVRTGRRTLAVPQSLKAGRRYCLLTSEDLKTWKPAGAEFIAESDMISREFSTTAPGQFFRIDEIP